MNAKQLRNGLIVLILSTYCTAQPIHSAGSDNSNFFSSSTSWTAIGTAGTVAVTAILFHYDQQIYDDLYRWKMNNNMVKDVSPVVTNLGDGAFSIGLFGGFTGYALIFKDNKSYEVGKIGIESFLLTGISVQVFKYLCGRERPSDATRPGGFWHGPFSYFDKRKRGTLGLAAFDSFPSGHTTTAFAAATTISDFYTEPWVSYTCYSLATMVAISRVMERTHWLSDCFIGAILGYYGTKIVEKINYGSGGLTLLPQIDSHQYGLLLSVNLSR